MSQIDSVSVSGLTVSLTRSPGKPLIFLIRMASGGMGVWDSIWNDLARWFSVANFDLLQVPAASRLEDPARCFSELAEVTANVARGLGHDGFHLFGWNGGSLIALRCAMDHPDRVRSCILLDPFFELDDMRHVRKAVEFKRLLFQQDRELYAYYWVMAGLSDDFIANEFDTVERMVAQRMAGDRFVKSDVNRFMAWVTALRTNWFEASDYARITAPTLIAATGLDRWNAGPSVAMAEAVHDRIAGSELQVIDGVGGHFPIEDPERFLSVVEPFIRKVTG